MPEPQSPYEALQQLQAAQPQQQTPYDALRALSGNQLPPADQAAPLLDDMRDYQQQHEGAQELLWHHARMQNDAARRRFDPEHRQLTNDIGPVEERNYRQAWIDSRSPSLSEVQRENAARYVREHEASVARRELVRPRDRQQVIEDIRQQYPRVNADALNEPYTRMLADAHHQEETGQAHNRNVDILPYQHFGDFAVRHLPFVGAGMSLADHNTLMRARERINARTATPADYDTVARIESQRAATIRVRHESLGGTAASVAGELPAVIGEFWAGGAAMGAASRIPYVGALPRAIGFGAEAAPSFAGRVLQRGLQGAAVTPFVPSGYLSGATGNAEMDPQGRPWYHVANLGPALGISALNNAILGQASGGFLEGRPGQSFLRGLGNRIANVGIAMGEQQVVDAGVGLAGRWTGNPRFPQTYGVLGALIEDANKGGKEAFGQALMFGLFGLMHTSHEAPKEGPRSLTDQSTGTDLVRRQPGNGPDSPNALTRVIDAIVRVKARDPINVPAHVREAVRVMKEALDKNPNLTQGEALRVAENIKDANVREVATSLAEALPHIRVTKAGVNRPESPQEPLRLGFDRGIDEQPQVATATAKPATPGPVVETTLAKPFVHLSQGDIAQIAKKFGYDVKTADGLINKLKATGMNDVAIRGLSEATKTPAKPATEVASSPATQPQVQPGPKRAKPPTQAQSEAAYRTAFKEGKKQGMSDMEADAYAKQAKSAKQPGSPSEQTVWERKLEAEGLGSTTTGLPAKGMHIGDLPIPDHVQSLLDRANVTPRQKMAMEGLLSGNSSRALKEPTGVSHTQVLTDASKAFDAMKKADPSAFPQYRDSAEFMAHMLEKEASHLEDLGRSQSIEGGTRVRLSEVTTAMDKLADHLDQEAAVHEQDIRSDNGTAHERAILTPEDIQRAKAEAFAEAIEVANRQSAGPETPSEVGRDQGPARPEPAGADVAAELERHGLATAGERAAIERITDGRGTAADHNAVEQFASRLKGQIERAAKAIAEKADPKDGWMLDAAKKFLADDTGAFYWNKDAVKEKLSAAYERIKTGWHNVMDGIGKYASENYPTTTRIARTVAEKFSQMISAPGWARLAAPEFQDRVLGKGWTPEQSLMHGTVHVEWRLRYAKNEARKYELDFWNLAQKATDPKEKAKLLAESAKWANKNQITNPDAIVSLIGDPLYPHLPDFATYKKHFESKEFKEYLKNHKEELVPTMDENFKGAMGLDEHDHIDSWSQIPGYPINLIRLKEGDPAPWSGSGGRGNLRAPKLSKPGFAREASLTGHYDVRADAMIENTLRIGAKAARKAEAVREMIKENLAQLDVPGQTIELDGKKTVEFKDVNAPRGTQDVLPNRPTTRAAEVERSHTSLYVHEEVAKDWRQALGTDEKSYIVGINEVGALATRASMLGSTLEILGHINNHLMSLFRAGTRPWDHILSAIELVKANPDWVNSILGKVGFGKIKQSPEVMNEILRLMKMGAWKDKPGMDTGQLWGGLTDPNSKLGNALGVVPDSTLGKNLKHTDPTHWLGKLIDVSDGLIRLTMARAFKREVAAGRAMDTETNERNFINKGAVQYNKLAQMKWLVFFRDIEWLPFGSAATQMGAGAVRQANLNPGLQATSWHAALHMRAEMLAKQLSVAAGVAALNYALWKNIWGDDDTPLGAIKTGERDGHTTYFNLMSLTGVTRGHRMLGTLAVAEGFRRGESSGQIANKATQDIGMSIIHTLTGPLGQFGWTAFTGKDSLGRNIAERNPEGGLGDVPQRLSAAAWQASPLLGTLAGAGHPGRPVPWIERATNLLGPFNPVKVAPSSAMLRFREEIDRLHQHNENARMGTGPALTAAETDRFRTMTAANHLLTEMNHASRDSNDDALKTRIYAMQAGLARAMMGVEPSANQPNPLRPENWASLPNNQRPPLQPGGPPAPSVREAVLNMLAAQVGHLAAPQPRYQPGQTTERYQQGVEQWRDAQRQARMILNLSGMTVEQMRDALMKKGEAQRIRSMFSTPQIQQFHDEPPRVPVRPGTVRRGNLIRP